MEDNPDGNNSCHETSPGLEEKLRNRKIERFELDFKDLDVSITKKQILKGVFGSAHPGKMLALMGPSGAGKTTLLNCLAGRIPIDSGELTVNSDPIDKQLRRRISYVLQSDIFLPGLTCWETVWYTALLRLPESMKECEKKKRVYEIIDSLDMRKCLHTAIGSEFNRGLSGGEKKRTSIACELLTDPAVILLDEPTSGLDSSTAYSLVASLKKVAHRLGKTVVMTIHQPSSQIFHLFDRLLLLADGQVAYFGDVDHCGSYFAGIGLHCPSAYNLSDYILDQLKGGADIKRLIFEKAVDIRSKGKYKDDVKADVYQNTTCFNETESEKCSQGSLSSDGHPHNHKNGFLQHSKSSDSGIDVNCFTKRSQDVIDLSDIEANGTASIDEKMEISQRKQQGEAFSKWPTGFMTQFSVLFRRSMRDSVSRALSKETLLQLAVVGLIAGFLWFRTENKEYNLNDRAGVHFFYLVSSSFQIIPVSVFTFAGERAVVNKERLGGYYRLSAYVLAKYLTYISAIAVRTALIFTIVFWLSGISYNFDVYMLMMLVAILCTLVVQSMGEFFGALVHSPTLAMTCCSTVMLCSMLTGGFYVKQIPTWAAWMKYTSFICYAFYSALEIDLRNTDIQCADVGTRFKTCLDPPVLHNGTLYIHKQELLDTMTLSREGFLIWHYLVILLSMALIPKIMTYFVLRFVRKPKIN